MVDDVDDLTLSQVCQNVENEYFAFEGLQNLTLTQTLQNYQQDSSNDLENDSYGEFVVDSELGQNKRFGAPVSEEDLSLMIKQIENQNTKNNTKWAFNVFEKWRLSREGVVPELLNMNSEDMDFWLQRFIVEARRKDGVEYPPKSLYLITCGLLRYLRDADVNDKYFLDEQNLNFCKFRKVLDARMKMLIEKGIGCEIKQAEPITQEQEESMWREKVFGKESAEMLQRTMFFIPPNYLDCVHAMNTMTYNAANLLLGMKMVHHLCSLLEDNQKPLKGDLVT